MGILDSGVRRNDGWGFGMTVGDSDDGVGLVAAGVGRLVVAGGVGGSSGRGFVRYGGRLGAATDGAGY